MSIALPMPERFVPQTIRKAMLLDRRGMMDKTGKSPANTAIRTEPTANVLPVILPPLLSILTILIIPRTSERNIRNKLIKKVSATQPVLGFSVRGIFVATRLGMMKAQPQRAQINEKRANLLIFTVTGCFDSSVSVIGVLQNLHTCASSGFSLLHLGQYICIFLNIFYESPSALFASSLHRFRRVAKVFWYFSSLARFIVSAGSLFKS